MKYLLTILFILTSFVVKSQIINWQAGIDVSKHQGKIDWNKLDTNIKFVYMKATEGGDFVDKRFKENWKGCKIKKGAYHFFTPKTDPYVQAKNFLSQYKPKKGDLIPVVDVEKLKSWKRVGYKKGVERLKIFMSIVEKECGVQPIVYTTGMFWEDYLKPHYGEINPNMLWVADYRLNRAPYTGSFEEWIIWQWTDKGRVSGIKGNVDLNWARHFEEMILK